MDLNIIHKEKVKKKIEFSKILLIQESILIWIETIAILVLAFIAVINDRYSELPWITAMVALPWTAYGVSQAFYYKKSMAENTCGGIKYESIVAEKTLADDEYPEAKG